MSRKYTHVKILLPEIKKLAEAGKSQREIAEQFGFRDKYVVKGLLKRERKNQEKSEAGIELRRRGRPPKGEAPSEKEKDYEIKRLKRENELLRDFLRLAGRR